MIFIPYISLYLQYIDIYGANIIKRNETGKLSGDYFLSFCIFQKNDARSRLQMTQIHPSLYPSHINVFLEKSIKVSLFTDISLIHNELQNDTSKYIYKEVS